MSTVLSRGTGYYGARKPCANGQLSNGGRDPVLLKTRLFSFSSFMSKCRRVLTDVPAKKKRKKKKTCCCFHRKAIRNYPALGENRIGKERDGQSVWRGWGTWSLEMFIILCSAGAIHCSFSHVLPFQGSFEVILCFGTWWNQLCWISLMFVWCLAQMAHLPFTCSAPGAATPSVMPVGTCAAFRKWANLSQGFNSLFLTSLFPCNCCLLCTCSIKEGKRLSGPRS